MLHYNPRRVLAPHQRCNCPLRLETNCAHSVSHYYPHQSQEREGDTAWCHSKLGPHSTPSPAGEEQFSRILLSRDDAAAGGVSKRRRLERSRRPRRHKLGPVSAQLPAWAGRRRSQRGARRRRATLSLSNGGGSSLLSIKTPGTLSSSWVLKIDLSRELQLSPYPPLGKCRAVSGVRWGRIQPVLEPRPLSRVTE